MKTLFFIDGLHRRMYMGSQLSGDHYCLRTNVDEGLVEIRTLKFDYVRLGRSRFLAFESVHIQELCY